jgi:5-methylcytosine-specific restriction endonuclease McrA
MGGEAMATDTLDDDQEKKAKALLEYVRKGIEEAAGGDRRVVFHVRRYIRIRLEHDERGTPAERKKLKLAKFDEQKGACPICGERFEQMKDLHLHRLDAALGYALDNVRLVHHQCHRRQQEERGYT